MYVGVFLLLNFVVCTEKQTPLVMKATKHTGKLPVDGRVLHIYPFRAGVPCSPLVRHQLLSRALVISPVVQEEHPVLVVCMMGTRTIDAKIANDRFCTALAFGNFRFSSFVPSVSFPSPTVFNFISSFSTFYRTVLLFFRCHYIRKFYFRLIIIVPGTTRRQVATSSLT